MGLFSQTDFQISNPAALGKSCGKCQRHRYCENPRVPALGKCKKGLMIIGTMPDRNGDQMNTPYSGFSYQYVGKMLAEYDIDIDQDCVWLNAVQCYGKTPVSQEIAACRGRVWGAIAEYKPKCILTFGMSSLEALLGHRWNKRKDDDTGLGSITRWAGWAIPDRAAKCWIVPTWQPAYIRDVSEDTPAAKVWFRRHIGKAVKCLDTPLLEYREENECIEVLHDPVAIQAALAETAKHDWFVFDYETTGIKPYRQGHKIICIGVSYDENEAFCFPVDDTRSLKMFCKLLKNPDIGKVAHNASFEDLWSREILGTQVNNWCMDTIQAAHIHNQNPGMINLKFLSYVRLGLVDYSSHISPYLENALNNEEEQMGANKFNQITLAPVNEVMKYCAIDCLSTYRIAVQMNNEMKLEALP